MATYNRTLEVKRMNEEYLPEWKPWKVRAEELEKLRAKDRTALDEFYFRNLDVFKKYSISYFQSRFYYRFL